MTRPSAGFWKQHLNLTEHIEGGAFGEIYRSPLTWKKDHLPAIYNGDRNACTHIYFLLQQGQFSAFHRIHSDELWHFYYGDPLIIYENDKKRMLTQQLLGNNPQKKKSLFCMIKGGSWFGSTPIESAEYSLVGCTVSPGFDFNDFELADKNGML